MEKIDDNAVMTGKEFKELLKKYTSDKRKERYRQQTDEKKREMRKKYAKKVTCAVCNVDVFQTSLSHHNKTKIHITNWNKKYPDNQKSYNEDDTYYAKKKTEEKRIKCEVCDVIVYEKNMDKHCESKKHINNLEKKENL